jgi:hypothetical protein
MDDIDKREAELLARLEAEREQRLAEKIANGEVVSVPLYVVAGSQTAARARVEQAKAAKLAEMHAAGDQREVVFTGTVVVTGVVQHGEAADPATAPSAPSFLSSEDRAIRAPLPSPVAAAPDEVSDVVEDEVREAPAPVEFYVFVTIRNPEDDGSDVGQIMEGYFSVEDGEVVVTDHAHKHIGSRRLGRDEDPKALARELLKGKPPSDFNTRRLSYPNTGLRSCPRG